MAHRWVYGYGELTWEWSQARPVRSAVFPLLFALPMWLLQALGLDSREAVMYVPLVVQGLVAVLGDWLTVKVARQWFGEQAAVWSLVLNLCSWAIM